MLVTGGLGFIGSNLAARLAQAGARVTIVDSCVPGCGANPHNLAGLDVAVIHADIGDASLLAGAIRGASVVFNLAGEISHVHSMRRPERDAALNAEAQLRFLEECARQAPGVRVVYASTRQIYGAPQYLPVDEAHPIRPVDFNGVHKYAAEEYHRLFASMGKLDSVVLRLTNVYGPRMALRVPCQGFLGTFLRRALQGRRIEIFGSGRQLRDPVYVDDVVDAFLRAGAVSRLASRAYNVGGPEPLSLAQIAGVVSAAAGLSAPDLRPFPEERKNIDIGSYVTDYALTRRELQWRPRVAFRPGIEKALAFYRREREHYLDPGDLEPVCALEASAAAQSAALAL